MSAPARRAPWYPDEEWADVPGFEGTYWVSSYGRVLSRPRLRTNGGIMHHGLSGDRLKYPSVGLSKGRVKRTVTVHRLVTRAFIGPPPPGLEVCHNDSDVYNARADNLRYDTHAANIRDTAMATTYGRGGQFCVRGHEFTPENTYYPPNVANRMCRTCRSEVYPLIEQTLADGDPRHGSANAYKHYGCRCIPCVEAIRAHWRGRVQWRVRKKLKEQETAQMEPDDGPFGEDD